MIIHNYMFRGHKTSLRWIIFEFIVSLNTASPTWSMG